MRFFELNFFKKFFKKLKNNHLVKNFLSFLFVQGVNYLYLIITIPYLIRVLGADRFGLIIFAQTFIQYFNIFTEYGFHLSATREISLNRENKALLNKIFNSVILAKLILLIIAFLVMTFIVLIFPKFRKDMEIYFFTFGIVIGQVFFPIWFFQGMEKMEYIMYLNFISKLTSILLILAFIHKSVDYIYVPIFNSVGSILAAVISLIICFKIFKLKLEKISLKEAIERLKEGVHLFFSKVGINMYKNSSILFLGFFTNNTIVGYFAVAKKIMDLVNSISAVISEVIFPYTVKLINLDLTKAINFLKKIEVLIIFYNLIIGFVIFLFSKEITLLIVGHYSYITFLSLRFFAFVPLIIGINVPAVHVLLANNLDKLFSKIILLGGMIDVFLNILLIKVFSYIGSCMAVIITETFVTCTLIIYTLQFLKKERENVI